MLCKFVGYPKNSTGYQFYHIDEQKIIVSRFATFLEKEFLKKEISRSIVELEEILEIQINTDNLVEPKNLVIPEESQSLCT